MYDSSCTHFIFQVRPPGVQCISRHRRSWYTGGLPRATHATFFSGKMYLMKHLISTIGSSHRNDHRTSSIDCDLHKLMNTILCELRNLKDLLSLSPLIIINNILSDVLAIIAFYVAFLLHHIVLCSVYMYHIVVIQPFGCNTTIDFIHLNFIHSYTQRTELNSLSLSHSRSEGGVYRPNLLQVLPKASWIRVE